MRIAVLGYLVRGPLGGMAWHHLQYASGLADLGHEVAFLEDSGDYPACYDPRSNESGIDPSFGLAFAQSALERIGFAQRWAYFDAHTGRWHGPLGNRALAWCRSAELLINVSGSNPLREWCRHVPARVFIDTDPVFTQIRHLESPAARERAHLHTAFFSFGENMGRGARIPDDGLPWQPTRQPIVLDAWPVTPGQAAARYTTVMQWDSYLVREYGGTRYGMKSESFRPFLDLPGRTSASLELSVGASAGQCEELARHGWHVSNPLHTASDPCAYQDYIRSSKGELTVAKHGYVVSRSGWFSERSAAYLASGRPVLTQDTGFGAWLPTGEGVLAFDTPERAVSALADVDARYETHCRAARDIAERYFDARRVLSSLLDRVAAGSR